jgi:signal transduction histidine kinase
VVPVNSIGQRVVSQAAKPLQAIGFCANRFFDFRLINRWPKRKWRGLWRSDIALALVCVVTTVIWYRRLFSDLYWQEIVVLVVDGLWCVVALTRLRNPNRFFLIGIFVAPLLNSLFQIIGMPRGANLDFVAALIVTYSAARYLPHKTVFASFCVLLALYSPIIGLSLDALIGFVLVVVAMPGGIGWIMRSLAAHNSPFDEQNMRADQLARELHDAVGHHLTATAVQVNAALAVFDVKPDRAREALTASRLSASTALDDLRQMVHFLETNGGTESTRQGITVLEQELQMTPHYVGFPTTLLHFGARRELTPVLEHTVYRVVQESITNIAKHVDAPVNVVVELHWLPNCVEIRVRNEGRTRTTRTYSSGGNGLNGMGERVRLLDGTFKAGPVENGWLVGATLPTTSAKQDSSSIPSASTTASRWQRLREFFSPSIPELGQRIEGSWWKRIRSWLWRWRNVIIACDFVVNIPLLSLWADNLPLFALMKASCLALVFSVAFLLRRRAPELYWTMLASVFLVSFAQGNYNPGILDSGIQTYLGISSLQFMIMIFGITRWSRNWVSGLYSLGLFALTTLPGVLSAEAIDQLTEQWRKQGIYVSETRTRIVYFAISLLFTVPLLIAGAIPRLRIAKAQRKLVGERMQLAGELRELVGNQVSGLVLFTSGALDNWDVDPRKSQLALQEIANRTSQTLIDLRRLVGILRTPVDGRLSTKNRSAASTASKANPISARLTVQ